MCIVHPDPSTGAAVSALPTQKTNSGASTGLYDDHTALPVFSPWPAPQPAAVVEQRSGGSALARALAREQRTRRRLRRRLEQLESQLRDLEHRNAPSVVGKGSGRSSGSGGSAGDGDPLFGADTPPSAEQLRRRVLDASRALAASSNGRLDDVLNVARRLRALATALGLPLDEAVAMAARHERLLLLDASVLPARLAAAAGALQLQPRDAAALLAARAPGLLAMPAPTLTANAAGLARVFTARGLDAAAVLRARPDLLTQRAGSVEAKLEALPAALSMTRSRVRGIVAAAPGLLRRSVACVVARYTALRCLLSVPEAFAEELVAQEPGLLCLSAQSLAAKFESLVAR
jgi:hypothetical protein